MRILIINYEYPPLGGGGGIACQQIAQELAKDAEVDVLTCGFKGLPNNEVEAGVHIYRVPVLNRKDRATASMLSMFSFLPSSLVRGLFLLRKKRYDVLNTWFAIPSGPTGLFLSQWMDIPNVLTIIGGDIHDPTKSYSPHKNIVLNKVVRSVLERATEVTAISSDTKDRAREYFGFSKQINITPLGIQEPRFSNTDRSTLNLPDDKVLIVAVGRLVSRKGYLYLIDAVSKLSSQDVELVIIGDGPEQTALEAQAAKANLEHRIHFVGFVSNEKKYQILSCADIFVLPSLHEGFGLVFLEAMYCGLPVITTDNGGQRDFLRNGKTGYMVPVSDTGALVECIEGLLADTALRKRMGSFNREYVKKFLITEVSTRYKTLFENTINLANKGTV